MSDDDRYITGPELNDLRAEELQNEADDLRERIGLLRTQGEDMLHCLKSLKTEINEKLDDKIDEVTKWLRK